MVWYSKEEIDLNDAIVFWTEVDAVRDYMSTQFYLDVDLYWGDIDPSNAAEIKSQVIKFKEDENLF